MAGIRPLTNDDDETMVNHGRGGEKEREVESKVRRGVKSMEGWI